jgi:tetratricopeptide (TPR) repeat protein
LAELRIDRRFDPVVAANPAHFDLASAVALETADIRRKAAASPGKLEGAVALALQLQSAGNPSEALTVLDEAIACSHPTESTKSPFDDYNDHINWAEDTRARVLSDLGRFDESLKQYSYAAGGPRMAASM